MENFALALLHALNKHHSRWQKAGNRLALSNIINHYLRIVAQYSNTYHLDLNLRHSKMKCVPLPLEPNTTTSAQMFLSPNWWLRLQAARFWIDAQKRGL